MPVFLLNTNVKDIPASLKKEITDVVSSSLGKPVSYIAVQINYQPNMSFGGTEEPLALCDLSSIGALSKEANKNHSKALMQLLKQRLNINSSRIYINFHNLEKANVGFRDTTFDDLM